MFAQSMRTAVAVVLALLLCAGDAPSAQSGVDIYRQVIADYRAGADTVKAFTPLMGWNAEQLESAVKAVIARADTPELEAAATMHLEIGIAVAGLGAGTAAAYFDHASRLMAATMPPKAIARGLSAERITDITEAYATVLRVAASALIAINDVARARPLIVRARSVAPRSAAVLTLLGLAEETNALGFDVESWDAVVQRTYTARERARLLALADRYYSDALAEDQSYALARIRLGHVQFLENMVSRARASLDSGRMAAREPRHRFLVAMFTGELQLQENDLDAARGSFEQALAIMPQSQNAITALAYTELVAGRVARAEQIARQYTSANLDDAWWAYKTGALDLEGLRWLKQRAHR